MDKAEVLKRIDALETENAATRKSLAEKAAELAALREKLRKLEEQEPVAWVTEDGERAVTDKTYQTALRDGGASKSAMASFCVPAYRLPKPAPAQKEKKMSIQNPIAWCREPDKYGRRKLSFEKPTRTTASKWHPLYAHPAPSAPAVSEWQPIETAPSDVKVLLGWRVTWPRDEWETEARVYHCTRAGSRHGYATHWMPLPAAPSHEKKEN